MDQNRQRFIRRCRDCSQHDELRRPVEPDLDLQEVGRQVVALGRRAADEVARFGEANAAEVERILGMEPDELYEIRAFRSYRPRPGPNTIHQ